jgi:hypothetical protein
LGYGVLAVALALLLWNGVRHVNVFYLDEWIYVGAAETIWRHLPGGLVQPIPLWNRGPQRAYSTLLAPFVGPSGRSTAFTAWRWDGDWSTFFDSGREWWGAVVWTVTLASNSILAICASATD